MPTKPNFTLMRSELFPIESAEALSHDLQAFAVVAVSVPPLIRAQAAFDLHELSLFQGAGLFGEVLPGDDPVPCHFFLAAFAPGQLLICSDAEGANHLVRAGALQFRVTAEPPDEDDQIHFFLPHTSISSPRRIPSQERSPASFRKPRRTSSSPNFRLVMAWRLLSFDHLKYSAERSFTAT